MVAADPTFAPGEDESTDWSEATHEADEDAFPARSGPARAFDVVGLALLVVAGLALRFYTRSPMWLDEALTVDISRLPLGDIAGALRHDGHPPLYYWMLHVWMSAFGTSDTAIRALAGIFGVATLPLAWLVGRRVGGRAAAWSAVALFTLMPYAVRYSTESRMYSLMMVLGLAAWLVGMDALARPRTWRLVVLAALTALMLWTHYWALWFGGAAGLMLLWAAVHRRRAGDADGSRNAFKVLGALAAGFVLFLPWVPTLLYQGQHTGTPWARRSWPTTILAVTVQDTGGGGKADAQLFGWFLVVLALVGVLGVALDHRRILLDVRGRPAPRRVAVLVLLTLAIAMVVGAVTNSAFQSRYNAVWLPFWVVLAGCGAAQVRGPVLRRAVLAVVIAVGLPGAVRNVIVDRSQAVEVASAIEKAARPGDLVVTCPDQLGPSLLRALGSSRVEVVGYPGFTRPERIDWVDYEARLRKVRPEDYAARVLDRVGDHRLFVAWDGTYRTHTRLCERFNHALAAARPDSRTLVTNSDSTFEHEWLVYYPPAASTR